MPRGKSNRRERFIDITEDVESVSRSYIPDKLTSYENLTHLLGKKLVRRLVTLVILQAFCNDLLLLESYQAPASSSAN